MNYTMQPEISSAAPAVRVENLSKRFGKIRAVDGLSFTVPRGSICGFLGPNGAGKTTTLRMLLGLARPNSGKMELLGLPMPMGRIKALEKTGALVEAPSFIEYFTGFQNLWWFGSLTAPLSKRRIEETLELVGLSEAAHKQFGTYSTGMKQRLGTAFAILHHPALLILDEPTNGMDPQGRAQIRDILRNIHAQEKTTIFLSSHLLEEVQRLCDYVVIVNHGRTLREGFVAEILKESRSTWELRIPEAETAKASEIIKQLNGVLEVKPAVHGLELILSEEVSGEVNRRLVEAGIHVTALIPYESSLEAVFLAITGAENEKEKHV